MKVTVPQSRAFDLEKYGQTRSRKASTRYGDDNLANPATSGLDSPALFRQKIAVDRRGFDPLATQSAAAIAGGTELRRIAKPATQNTPTT
ncbi:MAG: hypothetical protein QGG58_04990 [Chloroflexota bacterium]|nr:hypothetical protein [Chloroflexota bacterium]